ncbi:MAG: hypothetical protein HKN32_07105 [Flavobacteriales bacterium]|nr:hypothetical protein [Flavobacteriales bacterium]
MRNFLLIIGIGLALGSCTINKNLMFKTHTDFVFDTLDDTTNAEYVIKPNDLILMRLFTNDGARLLETTTGSADNQRFLTTASIYYTVEQDGTVELPEIGRITAVGLTTFEFQDVLEVEYEGLYNEPYALVQVMNNRVLVFPGSGARATVIPIENRNTTLIETLALAGGIDERGDASKVKLIRRDGKQYTVHEIDLSTIEGIDDGNVVVQANDIIYVEPVPEIAGEVFKDVSPFISLVSGIALIYAILRSNI